MIPATHTSTLLDPDEPDTIRLTEAEARAIGETAVQRIGYTAEDARIVVDQLIDNMLCGYKFAGLPRILAMAGDEKINDARTPIKVVKETTVSALMDGGNNIGYVTCYHAAQMAIEKAQAHGVSCVGVYNTYYSGRNAYFVEHIVNAGLVCMHSGANKPRVVPPGAARPALGTNPIRGGGRGDRRHGHRCADVGRRATARALGRAAARRRRRRSTRQPHARRGRGGKRRRRAVWR